MSSIYVTVDPRKSTDEFLHAYASNDKEGRILDLVRAALSPYGRKSEVTPLEVKIPHFASNEVKPPLLGDMIEEGDFYPPELEYLVLPLRISNGTGEDETQQTLKQIQAAIPGAVSADVDIAFQPAYSPKPAWCPTRGRTRGFGSRSSALRAIGHNFLDDEGLDGQGVNVVIVDQGLDKHRLGKPFIPGWPVAGKLPGQLKYVRGVTGNDHGMLIARNVLSVAPNAQLFDLPLIPDRIVNVETFLSEAHAHLWWVLQSILLLRKLKIFDGPWVLVNAWAIFDLASENPPGNYSQKSQHLFNLLIREFTAHNIDVIFAAGNCGGFCPDTRCGIYDVGPGRSIFGAHSHASVLTVGALLSNGLWPGSSSQGPSSGDLTAPAKEIEGLSLQKPDLCAPSFFTDPHDAHTFNGGTSTACALAAGTVAALRGAPGFDKISTDKFFEALRQSALKAGDPNWDSRLGFGLINAETGFQKLSALT